MIWFVSKGTSLIIAQLSWVRRFSGLFYCCCIAVRD